MPHHSPQSSVQRPTRITPAAMSFCTEILTCGFLICSCRAAGSFLACWRMLCMTGSCKILAICTALALLPQTRTTYVWVALDPLHSLLLGLSLASGELRLHRLVGLLLDLPRVL